MLRKSRIGQSIRMKCPMHFNCYTIILYKQSLYDTIKGEQTVHKCVLIFNIDDNGHFVKSSLLLVDHLPHLDFHVFTEHWNG